MQHMFKVHAVTAIGISRSLRISLITTVKRDAYHRLGK